MSDKILISTSSFDASASPALRRLTQSGFEVILNPYGRRLTESEARDLLKAGVVGLIAGVEPLTRAVIMHAKDLKVISRCGIGMDNVDLSATAEKGILTRNTPDAPGKAVAELTLGLMLNLLRKVTEADRRIRANDWKQLMGRLLSAQTVGLVGYGRIGKRVARLLRAFDANVLVYDKYASPEATDVVFCPLDDLIARADIVSLHVPYALETHHLLNKRHLDAMKKGALVINASRGGLIDETALLSVLESGHLGGAALDCFETEPYNGPLAKLEQVLLTAHMGSYAKEARALMEQEAADNLLQGLMEQGLVGTGKTT